ncbi:MULTISPECIES: EthD domain-containing protein [Dietzia]|uniref:EthD domain-containing protein n=1 Tax=Dietzia TaxID=37914 RepID=UPI0022B2D037|nr:MULTISPECIES: EthD domain-containing protein [Dietzia]MCZ4538586.1 EthD domain-containing protein [Dietzia maris]MDV3355078.1 EthD domain-containing protein [Dietzia sp. IN118]
MYNLIVMASKPSEWTHEQFIEWWRGEHADVTYPLPGLRRWSHTAVKETGGNKHSLGWDGVSVLSFDSKEAYDAMLESPEWAKAAEHVGSMGGRAIMVMGDEQVMVSQS